MWSTCRTDSHYDLSHWECSQEGNATLVRYGKAGSTGVLQQKTFADEQAASKFLEKEIAGKGKKGYFLCSNPLC